MLLNELKAPEGANKKKKRIGRGESSGWGKTSGRGHKGQKARSGGYHKVGFEGGQMPLARRLPKRGFSNKVFRTTYVVVNLCDLEKVDAKEINLQVLVDLKVVKKKKSDKLLKVLGNGEISKAVEIKADKFSKSAVEKIEKAGGKAIQA